MTEKIDFHTISDIEIELIVSHRKQIQTIKTNVGSAQPLYECNYSDLLLKCHRIMKMVFIEQFPRFMCYSCDLRCDEIESKHCNIGHN